MKFGFLLNQFLWLNLYNTRDVQTTYYREDLCISSGLLSESGNNDISAQPDPISRNKDQIGMFDLKYTLAYDLKDSLKVLYLWDDIHAVSTLQGVVNRSGPHLYINYIKTVRIEIDTYWWDKYRKKGEWLFGRDTICLYKH